MTLTPAIEELPPPGFYRQMNCWHATWREYITAEQEQRRDIILTRSRRVVLRKHTWWSAPLYPLGYAICMSSWALLGVGLWCMRVPFAHCLSSCKRPQCAISYEPPRLSTEKKFPPFRFKGTWKAWRSDCRCIRENMHEKANGAT